MRRRRRVEIKGTREEEEARQQEALERSENSNYEVSWDGPERIKNYHSRQKGTLLPHFERCSQLVLSRNILYH